ncbi:Hypothetical protein SRAE_1000019300 [Strongyloides ratti]|uniref:AT hook, DNA-binding motif-containing protein n=1 Tax=Strongyloides ratti TaxID=34506 RepID=A0A090L1C2_STRRB|nr:Hypothetical protein SRAE_1000019300 [Strongyloides ratti]CEF61917.1 Hypothetical protein SRAE_1000019300 [Strongyloides ratti]
MAETDINVKATEEPVINNNKNIEEGTENGTIKKMHEEENKEELPSSGEKKDVVEEEKCDKKIVEPKSKDNLEINDNKKEEEINKDSKTDDKEELEENKVEEVNISKVVEENKIDDSKTETKETEVIVTEKNDITPVEKEKSVEKIVKDEKTESVVEETINNSESMDVQESPLAVEKPKGRGRKAGQGTPKVKEPIATENGESIANSRPRRSTVKNVDYTGADTAAIWSALTPKGSGKKRTSIAKTTSSTKKSRGRKRKTSSEGEDELSEELSDTDLVDKTPSKKSTRGKGGPKKTKTSDDDEDFSEVVPTSKKRGAPKERAPVEKNEPRKRGRPSKIVALNGDDTKEEERNTTTSSNEAIESDEQKMDTTTNCEKTAVETN